MKNFSKSDHRLLMLLAWTFLVVLYAWIPPQQPIHAAGPADTIGVYEVDGANQNGRVVGPFGREFVDGDITSGDFPQPQITGQSVTSWQADCKEFYASGSPKFCVISYVQATLAATTKYTVSFTSNANTCSSCTGGTPSGYLTASTMASFNVGGGAGTWDSTIVIAAPGSTTVTVSAKTLLGADDPGTETYGNCKNNYWLRGPVITAVIVQDCSSAMSHDFGWTWNGSTMSSPVTGTTSTATIHPMFILYFVPSENAIYSESIYELPWWGKIQDQLADPTFKTSNASGVLTTRYTRTGARFFSDATMSVTAQNPPLRPTVAVSSASANFTSTDIGLPVCWNAGGTSLCGQITAVGSSTTATFSFPVDCKVTSASNGTNQQIWIDLQASGARYRKSFWVGTSTGGPPLGHIRIDYNFPYLIATKAIPNWDLVTANTPNPDHGYYASGKCCGAWAYSDYVADTDMGDLGGHAGWETSYASVVEGRILSEDELRYGYNMGSASCISPNSACAKAWDMLTGEVDANASTTLTGVSGGGGDWNVLGGVPFHYRDSRTAASGGNQTAGNALYVSQFEHKNALANATQSCATLSNCLGGGDGNVADPTGPNDATGHAISRHAHSDSGVFNTPVGTRLPQPGGWDLGEGTLHWLDFSYLPYLLTGSPYYLEECYFGASFNSVSFQNPGTTADYLSGTFWGYINPGGALVRALAWGLQSIAHAAFIAPDGSAEQAYYKALVNSNLEVQNGVMNLITGPLKPTDVSCSGSSCTYSTTNPNRFNFGAATVRSKCVNASPGTCTTIATALHMAASGECPIVGAFINDLKGIDYYAGGVFTYSIGDVVFDDNNSTYYVSLVNSNFNNDPQSSPSDWSATTTSAAVSSTYGGMGYQYSFLTMVLAHMQEMGFSDAEASDDTLKSYVERILDSHSSPWWGMQEAYYGTHDITGGGSCGVGGGGADANPYLNSYVKLKSATQPSESNSTTFDESGTPFYTNFACNSDHGYSTLARAALSFAQEFNVSSIDSGTGGTLTAASAWTQAVAIIPYFNLTVSGSTKCSTIDITYGTATDEQAKFALAPRTAASSAPSGVPSGKLPVELAVLFGLAVYTAARKEV